MRDLLFKNLTSQDRRRKVIASRETSEQQGMRSIIQRHFIYTLKELKPEAEQEKLVPYAYVRKERDSRQQTEKFYCKIKGSTYAAYKEKLFLIRFMHTLKISLTAAAVCQHK